MTQAEYKALYAKAARQFPKISRTALIKMRVIYESAALEIAEKLEQAILTNKSEITIQSFKSLLQQLRQSGKTLTDQLALNQAIDNKIALHISNWAEIKEKLSVGSESIREAIETIIPDTVRAGNQMVTNIHEAYLVDASFFSGGKIIAAGLENMFNAVNNTLVANIANRIWQDGYTFSTRVWNLGLDFQDDIKRVVLSGLAQGRDIIDIAADLNVYVKYGKRKLITRYGLLKRGTAAFRKRIRKQIYYPSLRLIRSELYASLQQNSAYMGTINPATSGLFDWIRANSAEWNCSCPEYQRNSPYLLNDLPDYPHPNCLCRIQPRMRNTKDFQNDLKKWVAGGGVPYINDWYNMQYLGFSV